MGQPKHPVRGRDAYSGGPSRSRDESGEAELSDWTATHELPRTAPGGSGAAAFTPGTVLAERYRIVAPLGKGGMGEVYRADDIKLGQPVALKFLHGSLSSALRERLYAEVRVGRQVSHPNVCRLYDIVEVEGQTFLAMEYVDGEDLASLLGRIGRLPSDKALDIARDLCAGLSAAHDKGIVHRDLKPANVMIDGRGRARLTDFGLAIALEDGVRTASAGTPVYMSPEQLANGSVTLRSDLYAFGLLLFEMLTGRRFFDARTLEELHVQHRETRSARLSSASRLLDPAVERLIVQCLAHDPADRPASARAVIALLPGGDPLEAAVAAGETPSPEMVAAAAKVGDLEPGAAWAWLGWVLAGLVLIAFLTDRTSLLSRARFPKPPEALAERAKELLARVGYPQQPVDDAYTFDWDAAHLQYIARNDAAADRWERLRTAQPGPAFFMYRQSPRRLIASNRDGVVVRDDPPMEVSGMTEVVLDPRGRLLSFLAVPPQMELLEDAPPEPDFAPLFQEAGLDPAAFKPARPRWAAPVDSDRKAAWEGVYPGEPGLPVRVEAASFHGKPVWFEILTPWSSPSRMRDRRSPASAVPFAGVVLLFIAVAIPLGGIALARRNLRSGRGDRKSAFRVALFVFVAYSLARLLRADHVSVFADELWILIRVFAYPSFWAILVWLMYVALEPYARRRWPHMLISWKRLLSGSVRDPLVGRDVLIGAGVGLGCALLFHVTALVPGWLGKAPPQPDAFLQPATLTGLHQLGFRLFVNQYGAVLYGQMYLFLLVLLRLLLRKQWLAAIVWCALLAGPLRPEYPLIEWIGGGLRMVVLLLLLTYSGLLSLVSALFFMFLTFEIPVTLDPSSWYAAYSLPVVLVMVGVAVWGFHTALAGKPIFGRLED
jgi:serine/threonine-protein kinase